jgi:uncharacterized repeat protein (TIGR03803 family)
MKIITWLILLAALVLRSYAQTNIIFTRVISFDGTNGAMPKASLTIGRDGNLYGTTSRGGKFDKGTIFKISTNEIIATIFSFDGTNGWSPDTELAQGRDGKLYGICFIAGVFSIATNGSEFTSLHRFSNQNTPTQGLTLGADGSFYGYEPYGGTGRNGAIFRITPEGKFETVLSCGGQMGTFCNGLKLGRDGNLYGTMASGGKFYTGNFFRLTTNGDFTILASFNETNNIRVGRNQLTQGIDGDFYGTTRFGGSYDNRKVGDDDVGNGTLFKVSTNGVVTTLASFNGWNGAHPVGALIQTSNGDFFGVTLHDMALVISQPEFFKTPTVPDADYTYGTVFRATTNGDITRLYSFTQSTWEFAMTNGAFPCGLIRNPQGVFYGTTTFGGEQARKAGTAAGTIFKFRVNSTHDSPK